MRKIKIYNPVFFTFANERLKKLNFMTEIKYKIVERASGIVIACEVSRHANPAHDAFLKGYDLFRNKAVY